ncbi:DUF1501 domain-containing protein [Urbifossiella limnaea]|uniref:DUF1501 domain-containing protein n=1 Tax=Urbifossiella limnaea TaxID=2528023 RepID=A0A517Y157_9BACT|nr:DUF1501 domain-containing protein [Urbifossiella limnaea]QDU23494.1 hypothetical protein ETAA1_54940 [Urbifossiella limnaea]
MNRRDFLAASAALAAPQLASADPPAPRGKAEACIFVWLGGGMGQIDTFDPKARGLNKGTPKKAGSLYDSVPTATPGVRFCEHLPRVAAISDRLTAVRTVNHSVVDEHAFATNLVHTGRVTSGNVVYPSVGSIVAHERGAAAAGVPPYVLIGYPNVSRGPGFLGSKAGFVYLTDTAAGPAGFARPADVDEARAAARRRLLEAAGAPAPAGSAAAGYEAAQAEALRLAGPGFLRHFDLTREASATRERFGGEFGQRCLVARRLVEAGVRFVEVSHNLNFLNGTGWDVHNDGIDNQHLLVRELDAALSALVLDLESRKLLDRTLVVVATEFGRPPEFDGGGGRGHQGTAFSMVLAGGGLRHRGAYGVTDDLAKRVVSDPVPLVDFHATVHAALGIDPAKELYDGPRPVPITDGGRPVRALFA